MGIVVEEKSLDVKPALDFITQPANESVQKKVQESLERLNSYKPQEVVESIDPAINVDEPETLEKVSKFVRTYEFNGRLGTISSVPHTKAEMTLAKANDEMPEDFPIRLGRILVIISMEKVRQDIIVQLATFILNQPAQNQNNQK